MTRVVLEGLEKRHPGADRAAVSAFDLTIESGALTVLLGPSGSGKSTVLRMVAGLTAPDGGDIRFDGRSVLALRPEQRSAVMVFQDHLLFPTMTVAENVGFSLRMRGHGARRVAEAVDAMLERVRLGGFGGRKPGELSGGQQQRVALARALVAAPRVLLLDEPFSSLDPDLRQELRGMVRELQRETGVTTLLVSHDREEALAVADLIAVMEAGRLLQVGLPRAVYERPASPAAARLLGPVNILGGTLRGGRLMSALGEHPAGTGAAEGPVRLLIRPEGLAIGAPVGGDGAPGRIVGIRYLGPATVVTVRIDAIEVEVAMASAAAGPFEVGEPVAVRPIGHLHLLPGNDG